MIMKKLQLKLKIIKVLKKSVIRKPFNYHDKKKNPKKMINNKNKKVNNSQQNKNLII